MELLHINLAALILIGLIFYSIKTWFFKGNFFHPGLIYSFINGLIFLIFAFGPYIYKVDISWSYYYLYAFITIAFVLGTRLGEKKKNKRLVKDITLNKKQLWLLAAIIVVPIVLNSLDLGILSDDFSLQDTAANKFHRTNLNSQQREAGVSTVRYLASNLIESFTVIATSIFLANSFRMKKYLPIVAWLSLILLVSVLLNSRTTLIRSFLFFIIPWYATRKYQVGKIKISKKKLKILFKKTTKMVIPVLLLVIVLTVVITNVRTEVRSTFKQKAKNQKYEYIEVLYRAEQKQWFSLATNVLPEQVVNSIAELSMYAGGTVATGGVTSKIVSETERYTWGLRNYFIVHRVLSQLGLDAGFSDTSRENWIKTKSKVIREIPAAESGWFGDPGNWLVDFGYIGAPLASFATGAIIGWMYSRFYSSGPVINSIVACVFAFPMLITPAYNFFSIATSNSISFLVLLYYLMTNSKKITNINYSSNKLNYFIVSTKDGRPRRK